MDQVSKEEIDLLKEVQDKCNLTTLQDQVSCNNANFDCTSEPTNGRISGGSQESAFSSASESSNLSSGNNSSSGRSSDNRDSLVDCQSLDDTKELNVPGNLEPKEITNLVNETRVRFLDSLKDAKADLYDPLDVEELRKPLPDTDDKEQSLGYRLISRFLVRHYSTERTEKDIISAVQSLKELLEFRHHYQLSEARSDQFSREFYIMNGMFPFGHDKNNVPILYIRASVHRKWSYKLDKTFRRYVAWQVDRMTKSYHGAIVSKSVDSKGKFKDGTFALCFDCLNLSYSCLDMDFLRFLVSILVGYYPTYCCYALCIDLPWLFRSVWKLVRSWLPEEARNSVHLIVSTELTDFINEDQIPNSMKFNDLKASEKPIKNKNQFPKNWDSIKGIEEFASELSISSSEVKQLKTHAEKVRKEYEKLGAL